MSTEKAVHLVLSAGGVRCLSYIGAIKVLKQHGVTIKSISCCSAGTLIGAFCAFDIDIKKIEEHAIKKGFKAYRGRRRYWLMSRLFSSFRYPFAPYKSTKLPDFFTDMAEPNLTLSACKIPFATVGMDIVNDRYVVFSNTTHPDMKVSEVITIATAVSGVFPPVERENRIFVDAAVSMVSPVWLAYREIDDAPIVVLKPMPMNNRDFMNSLPKFIMKLFSSSAESLDWDMFQANPRVKVLEINHENIPAHHYGIKPWQVETLIQNGAEEMIKWLPFLWSKQTTLPKAKNHSEDDTGAALVEELLKKRFGEAAISGQRNQIFISYHDNDEFWLNQMIIMMTPFLRNYTGLQPWSVKSIRTGQNIQESIEAAFYATKVALLLVTPDYLADDTLWEQQLQYFINAAQKNELELLWVLVAECGYGDTPLKDFKHANDLTRPLRELDAAERDEQLKQIAEKVKEALIADLVNK